MTELVALVVRRTGVTLEQMRSSSRERHVAEARALVYYLARNRTRLGWAAIARLTTGRDRSTARALYTRLVIRAMRDRALDRELRELEQGV